MFIIFVREDLDAADALASACADAGLSILNQPPNGAASQDYRVAVAVWSEAARRTAAFIEAANDPLDAGKALIANFSKGPLSASLYGAPDFDLSDWDGETATPGLIALINALKQRVGQAQAATAEPASATEAAVEATPEPAATPAAIVAPAAEPAPAAAAEPVIEPEPQAAFAPAPATEAGTRPVPKTPRPQQTRRSRPKRVPPRSANAQNKRRTGHTLHHAAQALMVSAAVFVLLMAGGYALGQLEPPRAAPAAEAAP